MTELMYEGENLKFIEQCAIACMVGLLSNSTPNLVLDNEAISTCYTVAQCMLRERNKRKELELKKHYSEVKLE